MALGKGIMRHVTWCWANGGDRKGQVNGPKNLKWKKEKKSFKLMVNWEIQYTLSFDWFSLWKFSHPAYWTCRPANTGHLSTDFLQKKSQMVVDYKRSEQREQPFNNSSGMQKQQINAVFIHKTVTVVCVCTFWRLWKIRASWMEVERREFAHAQYNKHSKLMVQSIGLRIRDNPPSK